MSEQEMEGLIMALARGAGERGFTVEEAEQVVKLVEVNRVASSLINLAIKGLANIHLDGGELAFSTSELGRMLCEAPQA